MIASKQYELGPSGLISFLRRKESASLIFQFSKSWREKHRGGEHNCPQVKLLKEITVETRQSVGSRIQRTRQVKTLLVDINIGYSPAKRLTTKSVKPRKKRNEAIQITMDPTSRQTMIGHVAGLSNDCNGHKIPAIPLVC